MKRYIKYETGMYESFWKAVGMKFSDSLEHYTCKQPFDSLVEFAKLVKDDIGIGKVLDIGCGNGRHAIHFARQGFDSYGIDVSRSAIEFSRVHAKDVGVKATFKVGDCYDIPFKDSMFDAIVDCGCLHHQRKSQWKAYRREILRILKPGGYFYLLCFSKDSGNIPKFTPRTKNRNWTLRGTHYNHFFTTKEIKDLFLQDFSFIRHFKSKKLNSSLIFKISYMKRKNISKTGIR